MPTEQLKNGRALKKQKFLFVGLESLSGDLAWQLQKEGHDVKIWFKDQGDQDVYDGFLEKVPDWKEHVNWADVVVFDDVGFGAQADTLRKAGKLVVGGSAYTDRLEEDREFGQSEMRRVGMLTLPHWDFDNYETAIKFLKENLGRYAWKPSGNTPSDMKGLLFLGTEEDGKDLIEILERNKSTWVKKIKAFQIQKFASGVEVAVGAFFNGEDFVYPINVNFEHKKLFPGDIGPYTGDMGALMYWSPPNAIFNVTLAKMRDSLSASGYAGYIDINCIANARGVYPLEFTCFSDDTEILTANGWKLILEVTLGEFVATLNRKTHVLEYQSVQGKIVKRHRGDLIQLAGAGTHHEALDCLVTPDHQMYIQQRNGTYDFTRADAIPQGSKIPRACHWNGKEIKTYTVPGYIEQHALGWHKTTYPIEHQPVTMPMNVWLRFLGIFLAEGSLGGRNHIANIAQTAHKKEVRALLRNFPFRVREYRRGFQISSTQLVRHLLSYRFGRSDTKFVPAYVKGLSPRQIAVFLEAFRIGDGNVHRRTNQRSYFSTSQRLIDDLQELLLKCGVVANVRETPARGTTMTAPTGKRYRRQHNLHSLTERNIKRDYYVDKRNLRRVAYSGKVCCVEVPNHIIYVRRNGKAFWCGNCRFGYPTISVQIEGVTSPWGEFLAACAAKQPYELKTKKGFQVGAVVAVPPFPYEDKSEFDIYHDLSIIFKKPNLDGVHLGDVKFVDGDWRIAGQTGYALVVTGSGITVQEARAQMGNRIDNIMLQNMFYRTDIGERWTGDSDRLHMWGYLY